MGDSDYEYESGGDDDYVYEEEQEEDHEPIPLTRQSSNVTTTSETTPHFNEKAIAVPYDSYILKPSTEVVPILFGLLRDVAGLLGISIDEAQALLQQFKWDKERLIDEYFSNPEKSRIEAGIDLLNSTMLGQLKKRKRELGLGNNGSASGHFQCRICYDDNITEENSFALGCDHRFCIDCYTQYLQNQVSDGPPCLLAKCPEQKCKQLVTRSVFHGLLEASDSTRYDDCVLRSYIGTSKTMRHCPAPRCDKVAVGSGVTTILCSCSHPFCFRCGEEAHDPCSCSQLSDWMEKCLNESETANWILANTRKCPACQTRIEKNQGCNHMTCRMCKHEFCWICMGNWMDHGQNTGGFYKCNRFDTSAASTAVSAQQKAKAELDRYLHYYQRFHGHDNALKSAVSTKQQAEARLSEQQENQKLPWMDTQFLKQAMDQVIHCRRVLKHTYALGYFLKDDTAEKRLYEYHQEMLEKNTERLHEYTEMNISSVDRVQVVNLTRVTEKFMESLLQSMAGGIVHIDDELMMMQDDSDNHNSKSSSKTNGNSSSSAKQTDKSSGKRAG